MDKNKKTEEELVQKFDTNSKSKNMPKILIVVLVMGVLGIASGFVIAKGTVSQGSSPTKEVTNASQVTKGTIIGSNDLKTFNDSVEGELEVGGIEGEGQYHLVRPGGESQNVYLTSSAVDLSLLKGKKIKVWGQTQKAQYAGWLMDVGRVEVLE